MTEQQAVAELKAAHLDVQVQPGSEFSATIPEGSVLRTDPDAGTRLKRGDSVKVFISAGPRPIPPPGDVPPEQYKVTLQELGFDVDDDFARRPSDTVPAGDIIRTDPPVGTKVKAGQKVTIYVSTGLPIVEVPAIEPGTPFDEVEQALKDAHFKVSRTDEYSDTVDEGDVILPLSPDDKARKGSTVTVTVSKGPHVVTIPSFPSLAPLETVQRKLEDLGLHVNVETAFGGYANKVVGIDPPSGTVVAYGSTVTVTVV
jgi:serine/threonine-protein kinase